MRNGWVVTFLTKIFRNGRVHHEWVVKSPKRPSACFIRLSQSFTPLHCLPSGHPWSTPSAYSRSATIVSRPPPPSAHPRPHLPLRPVCLLVVASPSRPTWAHFSPSIPEGNWPWAWFARPDRTHEWGWELSMVESRAQGGHTWVDEL